MSINVTARSIGESQTPGIKLSAVIPCRNAADRLPRQLEALTREKWQGWWEVVIADNGSKDGTREVAERFKDRLPHLLVVDASAPRGASMRTSREARMSTSVGGCSSRGHRCAWCPTRRSATGTERASAVSSDRRASQAGAMLCCTAGTDRRVWRGARSGPGWGTG